jgi:hypothetical protein
MLFFVCVCKKHTSLCAIVCALRKTQVMLRNKVQNTWPFSPKTTRKILAIYTLMCQQEWNFTQARTFTYSHKSRHNYVCTMRRYYVQWDITMYTIYICFCTASSRSPSQGNIKNIQRTTFLVCCRKQPVNSTRICSLSKHSVSEIWLNARTFMYYMAITSCTDMQYVKTSKRNGRNTTWNHFV